MFVQMGITLPQLSSSMCSQESHTALQMTQHLKMFLFVYILAKVLFSMEGEVSIKTSFNFWFVHLAEIVIL